MSSAELPSEVPASLSRAEALADIEGLPGHIAGLLEKFGDVAQP